MENQKNLILALALSMGVLLLWGLLFPQGGQKIQGDQEMGGAASTETSKNAKQSMSGPSPVATGDKAGSNLVLMNERVNRAPAKILARLGNDVLKVSVDEWGRIVYTEFPRYKETLKEDAKPVSFIHLRSDHSLYLSSGILGMNDTPKFEKKSISQDGHSLILEARVEGGVWQRSFLLHRDSYVLEVEDRIIGIPDAVLFHQVVEKNPDKEASTFYEHVGLIGFVEDDLQEPDYEDVDDKPLRFKSTGGWIGIMNRYFIASIIGSDKIRYEYFFKGDGLTYQAGMLDPGIRDGKGTVSKVRLYLGPKSIPIMRELGVELERSVDFGWFAFIAKPLHEFLLYLYRYVPNYGLCIIILVILIKLLFYWPTQKSYESMAAMRKLQPELVRLKELYGDDRQRMSQEMMQLYKKHKVNPMGGCLPIVIQIPVFFALYKVLLMSIEMRHAPFYGWIKDLSAQDPYFVLPVLMGLSMLLQQRLNPQPPDPMQAKMMQFLPVIFTFLFLFFPAGLVLYWLVNNILSIAQQWYVLKVKKAL